MRSSGISPRCKALRSPNGSVNPSEPPKPTKRFFLKTKLTSLHFPKIIILIILLLYYYYFTILLLFYYIIIIILLYYYYYYYYFIILLFYYY